MAIKVYDVFRRCCCEVYFDGEDQESRKSQVLEKAKCSKKFSVLYYRTKCSSNSFDINVKDSSLLNNCLYDIAILNFAIIAKFQNKCNSKDLCEFFLDICQNLRSEHPDKLYYTMTELCYQNKNICDQINAYRKTIGYVKTIEDLRKDFASANCEDNYTTLCEGFTNLLCDALDRGIKCYESVDAKVVKDNEVQVISIGEGKSLNINTGFCEDLLKGDRTCLKRLHAGDFGKSYEYQGVVCKVLNYTIADGNKKALFAELRVLNLKHENIIEIYDKVFFNGHPIIIMENGGQSLRHAYSNTTIPDFDLWIFIRSISNAIDYLHCQSSIVHCNIKAENIVKNDQMVFKLIDFGLSHEVKQSLKIRSTVGYTPYFDAPELHRTNTTPTIKIDIWSFGMTILEVKDLPDDARFINYPNFTTIKHEKSGIYNEFVKRAWSEDLKEVLRMCLTVDPNNRCNASALKEFIEKVRAG